jgi:2'-hydroxyisoflavone reductase
MAPMRILILGGTVFLGRAVTDALIEAGHEVTHFNRGKSAAPDPRVETIIGDRTQVPLPAVDGMWDAVIDTSGYLPQVVRRSAEGLQQRVGRYLFVSSISVFRDFSAESIDEDSPLEPAPDPLPETLVIEQYGGLKAACEAVVRDAFADRALIVRPGLIVGPRDPTDRFTWWPARIARGGRVAAPGRPERPIQFIDVRDLAEWMVRLLEQRATGAFNATSPPGAITMGELLEACTAIASSEARVEWLDEDFLVAREIKPWMEMPLWIPQSDASRRGFMSVRVDKAAGAGLEMRAVADTVRDTLAWASARPADHAWKTGLAPERERELLEAWDSRPAAQIPSAR